LRFAAVRSAHRPVPLPLAEPSSESFGAAGSSVITCAAVAWPG
jgi:hypothetical protein